MHLYFSLSSSQVVDMLDALLEKFYQSLTSFQHFCFAVDYFFGEIQSLKIRNYGEKFSPHPRIEARNVIFCCTTECLNVAQAPLFRL